MPAVAEQAMACADVGALALGKLRRDVVESFLQLRRGEMQDLVPVDEHAADQMTVAWALGSASSMMWTMSSTLSANKSILLASFGTTGQRERETRASSTNSLGATPAASSSKN